MRKQLLIVPVLAAGVVGFVLLTRRSKGPEIRPRAEVARRVRVLAVAPMTVLPRATGYGVVRPGRVWQAVPQVSGRIVEQAPLLKEGNFLKAGTLLLRIDRADYDLAVAQAEAQLRAVQAQRDQLATKEKTLRASLAIEERALKLAQAEFARVRNLTGSGSVSVNERDRQERDLLTQELRVREVRNSLEMIGPDRKALEATAALDRSKLEKARLDVARTSIRAPFDCRIGPVEIEKGQVVQAGQVLFRADGIDASEVAAQFPLVEIRPVLTAGQAPLDLRSGPQATIARLKLTATVRLRLGSEARTWAAEVTRVEGIDPRTRTIGIVVTVRDPYRRVVPGTAPPLVRGMYVEVTVHAAPRPGMLVVPRAALHDGHLYLVGPKNRLVRRAVTIAFSQSRFAVVRSGLAAKERIVLSDPIPAVAGMLLDPVADDAVFKALRADAAGEPAPR